MKWYRELSFTIKNSLLIIHYYSFFQKKRTALLDSPVKIAFANALLAVQAVVVSLNKSQYAKKDD